ncbi:MAG: SMC family ATPase [Alkalinema sp. RU_4_3]|nr:SMC family ATPase [Alkalinema sp. RU_4_3]
MIPLQLKLRNFLSYQEAVLDFRGLHTACICGPNGAGKSSLLEAMSWAIWGESRAAIEDDVIHSGLMEARVDFSFSIHDQTYRIIRSRQRGQGLGLEFQLSTGEGQWRSISEKGVRATQQLICDRLKLDYDTFVNSAYLRQGRADAFMLKRPGERKQILADLLKLHSYDDLADKAREQSRQYKGQLDLLEQQLAAIAQQLQDQSVLDAKRREIETSVAARQQQQIAGRDRLKTYQQEQQQRQTQQQQLQWHQQQQRQRLGDSDRLTQELAQAEQQMKQLEHRFSQEGDILAGFIQWQNIQAQEEMIASRFQSFQQIQEERQQVQQARQTECGALRQEEQTLRLQWANLQEQLAETQEILAKREEIESGLLQFQKAKAQLQHFDQAQLQAQPLLQRREQLQRELDRAGAKISARLDELRNSANHLQDSQTKTPQLQQAVSDVSSRITELEKLRDYQEQVREKGLERRSFMERLQAHQRNYETQLAEIDQIMQLLRQGGIAVPTTADEELMAELNAVREMAEDYGGSPNVALMEALPPCPLCDRPLDEHHWEVVMVKHKAKQQEVLDQIWVIREQLAVSEREIQVLRQEYQDIETKLLDYGEVRQVRGQLEAQLKSSSEAQNQFYILTLELTQVEQQLLSRNFGADLQQEMRLIDDRLMQIGYDERDHALARGMVDRWRWSDIKLQEIKKAEQRQAQINSRQAEITPRLEMLTSQIEALEAAIAEQLATFDQQLAATGYSPEQHNQLRQALRNAQSWQLQYQELQQSRQRFPQQQQQLEELAQALQNKRIEQQVTQQQIEFLTHSLTLNCDRTAAIEHLETQLAMERSLLDGDLSRLGQLQQQQQYQDQLRQSHAKLQTQYQQIQQQYRVYQELAQAFGKNGIPALIIENLLPQLETMTNHVLARLSGGQLHVQFVTQRWSRKATKAMETLDILIADSKGTRPYETYSGGEAFRINFAIRLSLARLLAQRSGTALQMLIVDEGFGTQDSEGCDRLITAINAIAEDFSCILTVTHMPAFRDAFQSRIEVSKGDRGSELVLWQ